MSNLKDKQIIKEFRLTNRLLAHLLIKDKGNQTEKIVMLENCGFSPINIADLLKIKPNIVRATLSHARKAEFKKHKPKASK